MFVFKCHFNIYTARSVEDLIRSIFQQIREWVSALLGSCPSIACSRVRLIHRHECLLRRPGLFPQTVPEAVVVFIAQWTFGICCEVFRVNLDFELPLLGRSLPLGHVAEEQRTA